MLVQCLMNSDFWPLFSFHFLVFEYATAFNGDLSTWNVEAVTDMNESTLQSDLPPKKSTIFTIVQSRQTNSNFWLLSSFHFLVLSNAQRFNRDISKWNVGAVLDMRNSTLQSYLPFKSLVFLDVFIWIYCTNFIYNTYSPLFKPFVIEPLFVPVVQCCQRRLGSHKASGAPSLGNNHLLPAPVSPPETQLFVVPLEITFLDRPHGPSP